METTPTVPNARPVVEILHDLESILSSPAGGLGTDIQAKIQEINQSFKTLQAENIDLRRQAAQNQFRMEKLATNLHQAEQALSESEERFHSILDHTLDAAYRRNLQTDRYDYLSPVFEKITGVTVEEMNSSDISGVLARIHPDDLPAVENAVETTLRECVLHGQATADIEYRFLCVDGTWCWLSDRIIVLPDEEGRPLYRLGTIRDISDLKRAEEQVAILARFPEENPRPNMRISHEGLLLYANPASARVLGTWRCKTGQVIPQPWANIVSAVYAKYEQRTVKIHCEDALYELLFIPIEGQGYVNLYGRDITQEEIIDAVLHKTMDELEERVEQRTQQLLVNNEELKEEVKERLLVEDSLRQANAYNRSLLEASLDPLLTITPEGIIQDVNAATEMVTGYTRRQIIGTLFQNYFTEPEKAVACYQQALRFQSIRDVELEIRHRDGKLTPVLLNASEYHTPDGQSIGLFVAVRDITARRQAEALIRLRTSALESAANGIFITDHQGTILWANPSFATISGYPLDEVIGQNPRFLKSGHQSEAFYREMWDTILSGQVWHGEIQNRRNDGSLYIEEQTITPILDGWGNITHFIAIQQDVTERKQTLEVLEKQEMLLSTVLDHLPVGIMIIDSNGNITRSNPEGERIWGGIHKVGMDHYGEFTGWYLNTRQRIAPDEWAAARAINQGVTSINEYIEIQTFDGNRKIILNSAIPLFDASHQLNNVIIVNQDISEIHQTQNELKNAKELLEKVFSSIDIMIAYMDRDFNFLQVNRAYAAAEDKDPDYFIGKNHFALYPHEENERIFRRVVETGEPITVYQKPFTYLEHPERGTTYWDWSVQPVKDLAGQVQGVVLSLADVTQRKRAELALQESEGRFRLLANHSSDMISRHSLDGTFLYASPACQNLLGYTPEELVGRNIYEWLHAEDVPVFRQAHQTILQNHTLDTVSFRMQDKARRNRWLETTSWVIYDEKSGEPIEIQAGTRDITERKEVEKRLEEERQRLLVLTQAERHQRLFAEALIQATQALNSSLDLNEVLDHILEQIQQVFPFQVATISMLEGDSVRVVRHRAGKDMPALSEMSQITLKLANFPMLKRVIATRQPDIVSNVRAEPSWNSLPGWEWVRGYIAIPLQSGDQVVGFLNLFENSVLQENDERIDRLVAFASQASLALHNANLYGDLQKALAHEQAMRVQMIQTEKYTAIGRMVASITHELNNPLQSIKNCLYLTRQEFPMEEEHPFLEMAASEVNRLSILVSQLREVYRPRSAGEKHQVDLEELLTQVKGLISHQLESGNVAWVQSQSEEDYFIFGVSDQIKQVFLNISLNAVEAMQPHGGTLVVNLSTDRQSGMHAIRFQDSGPGIDADTQARLFEPLFSTKQKGMGLGLSISLDIVQTHNGRITVESQPGTGTTFTVWLPLAEGNQISEREG